MIIVGGLGVLWGVGGLEGKFQKLSFFLLMSFGIARSISYVLFVSKRLLIKNEIMRQSCHLRMA